MARTAYFHLYIQHAKLLASVATYLSSQHRLSGTAATDRAKVLLHHLHIANGCTV